MTSVPVPATVDTSCEDAARKLRRPPVPELTRTPALPPHDAARTCSMASNCARTLGTPSPPNPAAPVPAIVPRQEALPSSVAVGVHGSDATRGEKAGHDDSAEGARVATSDHDRVASREMPGGSVHVSAASIWHDGAIRASSTDSDTLRQRTVGAALREAVTAALIGPTKIEGAMPNT